MVGATRHGHSHIQAAGSNGQHTQATAGRRMAVGAKQRFAGDSETFQMDLMTDAVTRPGEIDAVFF